MKNLKRNYIITILVILNKSPFCLSITLSLTIILIIITIIIIIIIIIMNVLLFAHLKFATRLQNI